MPSITWVTGHVLNNSFQHIVSMMLEFHLYHLPPGFLSLRKEEPLPELFPQTPVPSYSWPRSTQVVDKIVTPSCFRSSLLPCPFLWCPLCHSFSPPVVVETCNVSRPSVYCIYLISTLIACVLQTNPAVSRYYLQFLDTTGLSVSIGQIRWYTTSFNRLLLRFGQWKSRWLQAWFTGGMYFGVVAMFVAVILLVVTLINAVKRKPAEKQVLTPVVRFVQMLPKFSCMYSDC